MPFSVEQRDDKWAVINSETGDVKGEHDSEAEANEQLKALYANVEDVQKMESNIFIPITKVDAERREVWGWGAVEERDNSDEIMDYASSKPFWMEWSQKAQKRSGGKSMGNLRAMHQPIAAGKLIDLRADDSRKGFFLGARIVDDNEWKKVEAGVYTGFSVGGSYARRWMDYSEPGLTRYTAKPSEVSIVDSPCIPSATFEIIKADGVERRHFNPGNGSNMLKWEEGDDMEKDWDESKHPRDKGKFSAKPGGEGGGEEEEEETMHPGQAPWEDATDEHFTDKEPPPYVPRQKGTFTPRPKGEVRSGDKYIPNKQGESPDEYDERVSMMRGEYKQEPAPKARDTRWDEQPTGAMGGIVKRPVPPDVYVPNPDRMDLDDLDMFFGSKKDSGWMTNEEKDSLQQYVTQRVMGGPPPHKAKKMEGGLTLDEKVTLLKALAADIVQHIDDLQKQEGESPIKTPESIATIDLPSKVGEGFEALHMPEPNSTMALEMDGKPGQDELAQHAVSSKDLTSAFEAWLPKVGSIVKSEVAKAISDLSKGQASTPAVRMIPVGKTIKVVRSK